MEKQKVSTLREAIAENGGKVDFIIDQIGSDGVTPHTFAVFGNDKTAAIGKKAKEALRAMKAGTATHTMDEFKYQEVRDLENGYPEWAPIITLKGGLEASVTFSLL